MTRKDIPSPSTPSWAQRVTEELRVLMGKAGSRQNHAITLDNLPGLGGGGGPGGGGLFPGDPGYVPDLTPPPTPEGFHLAPGIVFVNVEHDAPLYTVGHGHAKTILYGAKVLPGDPLPTYSDAVELAQFTGIVYAYPTEPATTWRMWIKWVSIDGVESTVPAGGTNGVEAVTGRDVRLLLDAITAAAEAPSAPFSRLALRAGMFYVASEVEPTKPVFTVITVPITMNGVQVPTGAYMTDGFIMNGTITNAKIANLAVDNAKIANLSVSKLLAGSMVVGQYINSANYISGVQGWSINAAGTAEFSNAVVRGTVYANAGSIGGILMYGSSLQSANYIWDGAGFHLGADGWIHANAVRLRGAIMGGSFSGYGWPAAGTTGYYLGAEGLLVGNANNGRYVQIDSAGNFYAPNFSIVNGNASFSGYINATSGWFSGNLNAAGGTFTGALTAPYAQVDTLNVAGGAITSMQFAEVAFYEWYSIGTPAVSAGLGTVAGMSGIVINGTAEVRFAGNQVNVSTVSVYLVRNNDGAVIAQTAPRMRVDAINEIVVTVALTGFDRYPPVPYAEYSVRVLAPAPTGQPQVNSIVGRCTITLTGGRR